MRLQVAPHRRDRRLALGRLRTRRGPRAVEDREQLLGRALRELQGPGDAVHEVVLAEALDGSVRPDPALDLSAIRVSASVQGSREDGRGVGESCEDDGADGVDGAFRLGEDAARRPLPEGRREVLFESGEAFSLDAGDVVFACEADGSEESVERDRAFVVEAGITRPSA